jgi:hypothetical protein
MYKRNLGLFLSFTALIVGLIFYINFRPSNTLIHKNIVDIGLMDNLSFPRLQKMMLPDWLKGSLPDGLWMLALCFLILSIWNFQWNLKTKTWYSLAVLVGLTYEILQYFRLVSGRFDFIDIVFIGFAALLPLLFLCQSKLKEIELIK